ncbi:MAG: motility protein A [Kineosporiaceae bacterium]
MDLAVIIGLIAGLVAICIGIVLAGGDPMVMMQAPPIILVLGGTIGVTMMGGTLKDTLKQPKVLIKAFTAKVRPPDATVAGLVSLADKARREGLLALEDAAKDIDDPFLRDGLQLAIDGTDPEDLDDVMRSQIEAKRGADKQAAKFWGDAGAYAPTVGIIGTCLELASALQSLDDPAALGSKIALALIVTLWGVMSANVLFLPLAARLKRLSEIECGQMDMVVEGILAIQAGANPRVLARKLESLVPDKDEKAAEQKKAA